MLILVLNICSQRAAGMLVAPPELSVLVSSAASSVKRREPVSILVSVE